LRTKRRLLFLAIILMSVIVARVRAQQATVSLVPASYTVPNVGLTFTVNVTVENVEDLYGWELKLYYPNNVLNGTSATEGPFLKLDGNPTVFIIVNFTDSYNATYGLLEVLCLRTSHVIGLSGNGTLATIAFRTTATDGTETLHLANVKLSDPTPNQIPSTSVDGDVTVIPEFPAALILPLIIVSTLAIIILRRKIGNYREIFQSV
jgi:hypothetical protein